MTPFAVPRLRRARSYFLLCSLAAIACSAPAARAADAAAPAAPADSTKPKTFLREVVVTGARYTRAYYQ